MKEELPNPLYLNFHNVTSVLKISAPKYQEVGIPHFPFIFQIASALRRAGYKTSQCHCDPLALKTDAPGRVVFDCFRAYFQQKQLEEKKEWLENQPDGFVKEFLSKPATGTVLCYLIV